MKGRKKLTLSILLIAMMLAFSLPYAPVSRADSSAWWVQGPSLVSYPQPAVGLCYPWLVTTNFLIDLATGAVIPGTGGAPAKTVVCGVKYFTVTTPYAVYGFSQSTGEMVGMIVYGTELAYVNSYGDSVGLLDIDNNILYVKYWGSPTTVAIKLPGSPATIDYSIINGTPIAAFYYNDSYYIANAVQYAKVPYSGLGPLWMSGSTLYIQYEDGIAILRVTSVSNLTVKMEYYLPLPFPVTSMEALIGDYLIISSGGVLNMVDVNPSSPNFGSYNTVGAATLTPAGFYVTPANTTYVVTPYGLEAVPGYAIGVIGDMAITDPTGPTSNAVIYPLHTSDVVFTQPFTGYMYLDNYTFYLGFLSGAYRIPWGATLSGSGYTAYIDQPLVILPPNASKPPSFVPTAVVTYRVLEFPKNYIPAYTFTNVTYVASGADMLLVVQRNQAILFGKYGVLAVVPGTWEYGGVGPGCFVLYDGSALRLYDTAGNPVASYGITLPLALPLYMTCWKADGYYEAVVFYRNATLTVTPKGFSYSYNPYGEFYSAPNLTQAYPYYPVPHFTFDDLNYTVQPNFTYMHVSGLYASWQVGNTAYLLSVPQSTVYAFTGFPAGAQLYPIDSQYTAVYYVGEGEVDVIPYLSWTVSMCSLAVYTYPQAQIRVNGVYVGNGTATVFTGCNYIVNVSVSELYYRTASELVKVVGPTTVTLYPTPMITNATLNLQVPAGLVLNGTTVAINGHTTFWANNQTIQLVSMPTEFEFVAYYPVDACAPYNVTLNLTPGPYVLTVPCRLVSPVIALKSLVPVSVSVMSPGHVIIYTGEAGPGLVAETLANTRGTYIIHVEPLVSGYIPENITVYVNTTTVYLVNVTPAEYGRLVATANVPTASVSVLSASGATVANGVGRLNVSLPPGRYTVMASAPGFTSSTQIVVVQPGQTTSVALILLSLTTTPPPKKVSIFASPLGIGIIAAVVAVAIAALFIRRRRAAAATSAEVTGGGA